jgi:2-hydroxy-6-oxonona-2,4-dienedioate hydrolase
MSPSLFQDDAARERMEAWYDRVREAIPTPTSARTLNTSFGATHVLSAGPEDAPPLVALHGALANSALLLRELWHLTKHFRVHVVDVLGQSVKSADIALPVKGDAHGRWATEVMDQLGLERVNVLGVSWGGFVTLRFAAAHPERIERMALLVPAGIVNGKVLDGIFKLGIPMARFRRSPTPGNRERFLNNLLTTTTDDWNDYLNDAFQSYRMNMSVPPLAKPAEFATLKAPVLVIAAADDYSFPGDRLLARAKQLFPTLVHSELLAGVKHSPPTTEEFRQKLAGTLATFFQGA